MVAPLRISSLTTEYIRFQVEALENGVTVNPTSAGIEMAVVAFNTEPTGGDWVAGSWETDPAGPYYYGRLLVSTGDYADGKYHVWARITDNPEVPVQPVGILVVT